MLYVYQIPPHLPRLCEMERNSPLQLTDKENRALRMQQLVLRGASSPAENRCPLPPRPGVGRVADLAGTIPWSGGQGTHIPAELVCSLKARKDPESPLMMTPEKQA